MGKIKRTFRGTKEYALVYSELIAAARHRGTLKYQEVAKIMGIPTNGLVFFLSVTKILSEISEDEVHCGRPMLSSIAVNKDGEIKEDSVFYKLATQFERMTPDEDKQQFLERERQAVYDTWKVEI